MIKGDQGVCIAPAVGKFKLTDGLVVLASKPRDDIPSKFPQLKRGVGQGKEFFGILIDRARLAHHNIVEIGGKDGEGELSRPQIIAKLHHIVPRCPCELAHDSVLSSCWYTRTRPRCTIQSWPSIFCRARPPMSVRTKSKRSSGVGLVARRSTAIPAYSEGLKRSGLLKSGSRVTRHL